MDVAEPSGSAANDEAGTGLRAGIVFAKNSSVCVEDALGEGEIALNLGCGKCIWHGWVNIDGFDKRADLCADLKALPYEIATVDRIAAIHVFEHFYPWEIADVLKEWMRVLKPSGKLIVELPCMDKVLNHIFLRMKKGESPSPAYSWYAIWGSPSFKVPAMSHKWGYFKLDMQQVLEAAGFVSVKHEEARYHFPARDMRITAEKGE